MENEPKAKVTDKRMFTPEGEARSDASEESAAGVAPEAAAEVQIDFGVVVLFFYHQTIQALGLVTAKDESGQEVASARDEVAARYFIDMLGILQEKTRGNLVAREEKLLSDILLELRMAFVHAFARG